MVKKILDNYNIEGEFIDSNITGTGNINKTYTVTYKKDGKIIRYLVQKINTSVFREPFKLMKNIEGVTTHLQKQIDREQDTKHKTLKIVKTKEGNSICEVDNKKEYYRVYNFIEDAISYDVSTDKRIVFNTGKAFGNFQRLLSNYPIKNLDETIKDFHNTPKRLSSLIKDIKIDTQKRVMGVAREIVFILQREEVCSTIMEKINAGEIPLRVTHNDTKVNNVLMNKYTGDFLAVIDLDTVMPGSLLFDYGDGIRSTAASAKEDEKDLSKVELNLSLFEAYTDGYMSEMANFLTESELSLMAESVHIITIELAMRFLNDYINGDTYFKINYSEHNLDRARNQIKLALDIESKLEYMDNYIHESYKKYKNQEKALNYVPNK